MNLRVTSLLICAGLALLGSSARAENVSVTLTPTVVSQYMFRGVRLGGPALQPSVEVASGNWGVGIWASTPLADKVPGQSDPEIDPYAYYTFTVNDSLSIVPGVTYYTYLDAKEKDGFYKSTFEPYLAVNYTVAGVKFTPKWYHDMVLKGSTVEMNVAYTVPMKELHSQVDFLVTGGTYLWKDSIQGSTYRTKNWGNYYQAGFSCPFEITKTSKLTVGFSWVKGTNNYYKMGSEPRTANAAAVGRGVVSLSYAISF